ncbi:MAG TPA: hypothetical protein VHC49_19970 [Mycobacteriales bacterium]|nr:hypothetical protein [Mycobacteriales bacterium]
MLVQIRVSLPDRPGALGEIGRLTGSLGADIASLRVLNRSGGRALDDLYLNVPNPDRIDQVADAIAALSGVRLHGVRVGGHLPGAHPDLDLVGHVLRNPVHGLSTLTNMAPIVFGADWAVLKSRRAVVFAMGDCPDPLPEFTPAPGRTTRYDMGSLHMGITPLFGGTLLLVIGRDHGPAFHPTEVLQVEKVIELVLAAGACAVEPEAAPGFGLDGVETVAEIA